MRVTRMALKGRVKRKKRRLRGYRTERRCRFRISTPWRRR
jgi:hypothetical protein